MKLLNYFIDNINKYYEFFSNDIINNISNFNLNDCNHINLYGMEGSLKSIYSYYIINKLTDTNLKINNLKLEKQIINIKNNNIEFNAYINNTFIELNLLNRTNYDKHIITKFLINIIQNKNYKYSRHIIILKEFDNLTFQAFMALRRIMEVYSINALFICISTNLSKIPNTIRSRCFNIRCSEIDKSNLNEFIKEFLKDLNIDNYSNSDINKLIKSCDNNIYKILLKLDTDNYITNLNNNKLISIDNITEGLNDAMDIEKDPIKYIDILDNKIKKHLDYLKKTKNIFSVLEKNREFIYAITYFNYNNQIILEKFLKIILKKFNKFIEYDKIIQLTANTDTDIIKSNRDIYHFEKYLLNIYKMFHSHD